MVAVKRDLVVKIFLYLDVTICGASGLEHQRYLLFSQYHHYHYHHQYRHYHHRPSLIYVPVGKPRLRKRGLELWLNCFGRNAGFLTRFTITMIVLSIKTQRYGLEPAAPKVSSHNRFIIDHFKPIRVGIFLLTFYDSCFCKALNANTRRALSRRLRLYELPNSF